MHQGALVYINGAGNFDLQSGYMTGNCLQDILGNCIIQPATNFSPGTTTWSDAVYGFHDFLHIPSGVTLNVVNSEIQFAPHAKVIVHPNGTLILNNSRLTKTNTTCFNQCWQGVEVWGNSDLSPTPLTNQGMIRIFNGGSIENAKTGILADHHVIEDDIGDPPIDIVMSGCTGGIIKCDSAYFKNNRIAVQFGTYSFGNLSHFTRVNFITDNNMIPGINPLWFVKLEGVHTISFNGCTFKNSQPEPLQPENYRRGVGLLSYNSDFIVREQCISQEIPCNHIRQSVFVGLFRGIYALDMAGSFNPEITNTFFWGNQKGLYLSGFSDLSNVTVTCNSFMLNVNPMFSNDSVYGMYLDNCSGYHVEQNEFYSIPTQRFIGLVVNNSGANANEIYRNTFYNLMYATSSQNENRNGTEEGLCYICNKFVKSDGSQPNRYDFKISPNNSGTNFGIAYNQGYENNPANNMFGLNPVSGHYDFENLPNHVDYYYPYNNTPLYRLRTEPAYITPSGSVAPFPTTIFFNESVSCPSKLDEGTPIEELLLLGEAESKIDSLGAVLATLVDGGSTELLNYEVSSSTPPEALQTRNELISKSPYLSDTVMKTSVIKEEVLDNAMLRDVLVANPQSAKSDEIIGMIENRTVPMPDYMMEQILAGTDTVSPKETIEADKTFWMSKSTESYIRLLNHFKGDSVNPPDEDSLNLLFQLHNTLSSQYDKVCWLNSRGAYDQANDLLAAIPGEFNLTSSQLENHNTLTKFYGIYQQIAADTTGGMFSIDSLLSVSLFEIANSNLGFPATYARNILLANRLINYQEPSIIQDTSLKSGKKKKFRGVKDSFNYSMLEVYPNPASTYFILKFSLSDNAENSMVNLRDQTGKIVWSKRLTTKTNQEVIPVSELKSGIYLMTLEIENKTIESVKVTIVK